MNDLTRLDDLLEDNERASAERARDIVLAALVNGPRTPELDDAVIAVARGLFETAESHEEGVEALRFALIHRAPEAAAELLEDLDGADAVQRIHLVMMAEDADTDFAALCEALPKRAPLRRRFAKELRTAKSY